MKYTSRFLGLALSLCAFTSVAAPVLERSSINDDDDIVFDTSTEAYWYPHHPRLSGMTKPEQQEFTDDLNEQAYGGLSNWRFATLDEVLVLMEGITEGYTDEVANGPVLKRTPVFPARFFDATEPHTNAVSAIFCARTADEYALREDFDRTTEVRWAEGNYHFRWFFETNSLMFDDDTNYIADDARKAPPFNGDPNPAPEDFWDCGAWLIAFKQD